MRKMAVLFLLLTLNISAFSQISSFQFSCLSKSNGLPDNQIISMCQDSIGMVWVATGSGIVRYDGMTFHRFENDINDSLTIDRQVEDIHVDLLGNIWCATPTGIQLFHEETETFQTFRLKDDRSGLFYSNIRKIEDFSGDTLLLTSLREGPILYNTATNEYEYLCRTVQRNFLPNEESYSYCLADADGNIFSKTVSNGFYFWNSKSFSGKHFLVGQGNEVTSAVTIDSFGKFWLATPKGINVFDPIAESITVPVCNFSDSLLNCNEVDVMDFYDGKLFLGTVGDGLIVIDTATMVAHNYKDDPKNKFSIPDNGIGAMLQDASGNIWIGTDGNGIGVKKHILKLFSKDVVMKDCQFSRCNFVNDYVRDLNGTHWAAMDGGGLFFRNDGDAEYTSLLDFPGYIAHGVTALCPADNGTLWVGTYRFGLFLLDKNKNVIAKYDTAMQTIESHRLHSNFIYSVSQMSNGNVWVATNGGGVSILDKNGKLINQLKLDKENLLGAISCSDAISFYEDSKHRVWVGTYWGLNLFERDGTFIRSWVNDEYRLSNLSSNVVRDIAEDSTGGIWLATMYGINYLAKLDTSFICYSKKDGLVDNNVMQIQVDDNDDIWIATIDGLSKFDKTKKRFFSFYEFDGLVSSVFRQASFKDSEGKLYFGTDNGLVSFYPRNIGIDTAAPKVLITKFKIFNETIYPGEHSVLKSLIFSADHIELQHDQNYIGFEFTSQSFINYDKVRFKYRLIGADKQWLETDVKRRRADYSNLSPGDYVFQVHATNNDGLWSEVPTQVKIKIVPPFYKTALFRSIAITAILLLMIFFVRYREKQLSEANTKLEALVAERTQIIAAKNVEIQGQNEELIIVNGTKDRFFSIIAHDLKNPLNALMGFSGLLNDKYDDLSDAKKKKFIEVINDSSRAMYGLLVNLLDWARAQTGNIQYEPSVYNLMPIVEESVLIISPQAEHKNISIVNHITSNVRVYADINMLKTVLRNLIGNALKFSFRDDRIEIGVRRDSDSMVTVYVKDNGVGVPKKIISKIFSANAGDTTLGTEKEKGSGLGLIICKEFVEMNGGQIWCKSEDGGGSIFYFSLPLATEA